VEKAPPGKDGNWLFRSAKYTVNTLLPLQTSPETYRGVAAWVTSKVDRRLTFKDVARRAAMTRLANAPDLSLDDVAKYFMVHRNTIQIYHQMSRSTPVKAATILSRGTKSEPKGEVADSAGGETKHEGKPLRRALFSRASAKRRRTTCVIRCNFPFSSLLINSQGAFEG
jgi:hypothetical protein